MAPTPFLDFADRKVDGRFPVTGPDGELVAAITTAFWTGSSFEAADDAGAPLCSGRRAGVFSLTWEGLGPTGTPLVRLRNTFWGTSRRPVTLADGRELVLRGRAFHRDWALEDADGGAALSSVPTTGSWSFRPDAWRVAWHDHSLDLATVVAVVALHRLVVKASRAAAAG